MTLRHLATFAWQSWQYFPGDSQVAVVSKVKLLTSVGTLLFRFKQASESVSRQSIVENRFEFPRTRVATAALSSPWLLSALWRPPFLPRDHGCAAEATILGRFLAEIMNTCYFYMGL